MLKKLTTFGIIALAGLFVFQPVTAGVGGCGPRSGVGGCGWLMTTTPTLQNDLRQEPSFLDRLEGALPTDVMIALRLVFDGPSQSVDEPVSGPVTTTQGVGGCGPRAGVGGCKF